MPGLIILASFLLGLAGCSDAKPDEASGSDVFSSRNESAQSCIGPGYCVHYQNGQYVYGYYVSCVGKLQENGQCKVN